MQDRIDKKYYFCDHYNIIPVWYIEANMYIFWCKDCNTFILRDFLELREII
jgi:hypothetical protein